MAAKQFEVGEILPATTQLKISWNLSILSVFNAYVYSDGSEFHLCYASFSTSPYITINEVNVYDNGSWISPYTSQSGNHNYMIIDVSSWSESKRTITTTRYDSGDGSYCYFYWEDLNVPSGYSITFEENGGTTQTDLTEQTNLPNPLPAPTKANNVFAGWYLDSSFTQKAVAGATIESNVTLYAKWYTPTSWCKDIADAIREKEGSEEPIKHVDFADRITALPSPKEEQTKTVSPTTNSQDVLPDANKVLSKVTVNAIPTETKSQQPNLSSGNQTINATSGKFMTSFTITKDTINHIASNIRSGKTLYGVTGNLQPAKEEETKTLTPNFSSGNQVITPTSGKVLSQVTLTKPTDLLPENIAKDKNVCGVIGTSFIAIELTQTQYDTLSTKDSNTYYLIVEE